MARPTAQAPLCHDTQEYFRDVHDHLARINGTLDTIRDTISTAIQVNLSMVAIDESEVNAVRGLVAIFAVFTAFAGIWGMNFKFMPELDWHYGYPAAVAVIIVSAAICITCSSVPAGYKNSCVSVLLKQ